MHKRSWLLSAALVLACGHSFKDSTGWTPNPPGADADAKAQELIEKVWAAMGVLPAFQTRGELRFVWNFKDSGSLKKSENFYWNRFEHRIRWEENVAEGDRIAVTINLDNQHGIAYTAKRSAGNKAVNEKNLVTQAAFQRLPSSEFDHYKDAALKSFLQARRWLLGPLNLRDKGIHVKYEADTMAPDNNKYESLHVTFDPSADAENTGDELWWIIDPNTHLPTWMLWKQAGHQGLSAWSQEEWQDVGGGLKLATLHKQFKTEIEIQFANVQLTEHPEDELYFETVK
jgi:hypothetical protein